MRINRDGLMNDVVIVPDGNATRSVRFAKNEAGKAASYHILFDPVARRISGVIDFGVAEVGDPAADLAQIINNHSESFLRRMVPVYPAIAVALARARFQAGVIELWWLLQGLRTNDLSWFMVHIGRARDMLPWDAGV